MDDELLEAARDAARNAYVPYSHFPVGAALRTTGGAIVTGCNVENAAYAETICAERNAITTAVATFGPDFHGGEMAVVGLNVPECWPCGACRQVLAELGITRIVLEGPDGTPEAFPFEEILPHAFRPTKLRAR